MGLFSSIFGQLSRLPYPEEDCSGRVVIVTGANAGLGREAARHFVRLNASKVILGCRNLDRAAEAKADIEASTKAAGVVEVWQLDLCSFESVKEFAARARELERLDILLNNAGILAAKWEVCEGHEIQTTVNVISTLLLSILVLPTLRRTGAQFNIVPRIVTVSSDGAFLARFSEKDAGSLMQAFDSQKMFGHDRYYTTKLLQLMVVRKLAAASDASGKGHVLVNSLNPGLCDTQLFRDVGVIAAFIIWLAVVLAGRSPEVGSRTLMSAAFAGEETHGNWMTNCRMHDWPRVMQREDGEKLTDKLWGELLEVIEDIEPGATKILRP